MIWGKTVLPEPKDGDIRKTFHFAFLPTEIDDNKIIWLAVYERHYKRRVSRNGFYDYWVLDKTIPFSLDNPSPRE